MTNATEIKNDSTKPGAIEGEIIIVANRFRVFACHTRFESLCWMVEDMETVCRDTGVGYDCVYITESEADAVAKANFFAEKTHREYLMKAHGWNRSVAISAMDYYQGRMSLEDLKTRAGKYADEIIKWR